MSRRYADRKLAEALEEAGGSPGAARRIALDWIARDEQFLRELVEPFLFGIVGHALDRIVRQMPRRAPPTPARPLPASALDGLIQTLGRNFAAPTEAQLTVHGAVSARHVAAIHSLAKAHLKGGQGGR